MNLGPAAVDATVSWDMIKMDMPAWKSAKVPTKHTITMIDVECYCRFVDTHIRG